MRKETVEGETASETSIATWYAFARCLQIENKVSDSQGFMQITTWTVWTGEFDRNWIWSWT